MKINRIYVIALHLASILLSNYFAVLNGTILQKCLSAFLLIFMIPRLTRHQGFLALMLESISIILIQSSLSFFLASVWVTDYYNYWYVYNMLVIYSTIFVYTFIFQAKKPVRNLDMFGQLWFDRGHNLGTKQRNKSWLNNCIVKMLLDFGIDIEDVRVAILCVSGYRGALQRDFESYKDSFKDLRIHKLFDLPEFDYEPIKRSIPLELEMLKPNFVLHYSDIVLELQYVCDMYIKHYYQLNYNTFPLEPLLSFFGLKYNFFTKDSFNFEGHNLSIYFDKQHITYQCKDIPSTSASDFSFHFDPNFKCHFADGFDEDYEDEVEEDYFEWVKKRFNLEDVKEDQSDYESDQSDDPIPLKIYTSSNPKTISATFEAFLMNGYHKTKELSETLNTQGYRFFMSGLDGYFDHFYYRMYCDLCDIEVSCRNCDSPLCNLNVDKIRTLLRNECYTPKMQVILAHFNIDINLEDIKNSYFSKTVFKRLGERISNKNINLSIKKFKTFRANLKLLKHIYIKLKNIKLNDALIKMKNKLLIYKEIKNNNEACRALITHPLNLFIKHKANDYLV